MRVVIPCSLLVMRELHVKNILLFQKLSCSSVLLMLLNLFLIILIAPPQLLAAGNSLSSCPKVKWLIPGRQTF